jgi:hypothetical protein
MEYLTNVENSRGSLSLHGHMLMEHNDNLAQCLTKTVIALHYIMRLYKGQCFSSLEDGEMKLGRAVEEKT